MSARRVMTAVGLGLTATVGFALGGGISAWQTRAVRAKAWENILVEHQGVKDAPTTTRIRFDNPDLPVQAVRIERNGDGKPQAGSVTLEDGSELTLTYGEGKAPSAITAANGERAEITYKGSKASVVLFSAKGKQTDEKSVTMPVEAESVLALNLELIPSAYAQDNKKQDEDETITAARTVEVSLDINLVGKTNTGPGKAFVEASCAPLTCIVSPGEIDTPGKGIVSLLVSGSIKKSKLKEPDGDGDLADQKKVAEKERDEAQRALPAIAGAVAAVGVVASACRSLDANSDVCVTSLSKSKLAGALASLSDHEVSRSAGVLTGRARDLFFEEQARKELDGKVDFEVCVGRDGFTRACTKFSGRPLGKEPMDKVSKKLDLKRGIGGTFAGSFEMTQLDGADCKFSPSPKTGGVLRLSFDNEKKTVTASMKTDERGNRPNLSCSLGTANMSWSQNYSMTLTQTFTAAQLEAGGKLPMTLKGTMSGNGSFSFSNCRTSGGASANCPAGKSEPYSYPAELIGDFDLDTQKGTGRIVIQNAPLSTRGTWAVPAVTQ